MITQLYEYICESTHSYVVVIEYFVLEKLTVNFLCIYL